MSNMNAGDTKKAVSLRVQVPNNHILTQNLYYNYYYPKPKYLIIGYLDPQGMVAGAGEPGPSAPGRGRGGPDFARGTSRNRHSTMDY